MALGLSLAGTGVRRLLFPLLTSLLFCGGCAHSYYYLPEIEGEGAIHGRKGGIIYAIPPSGPAQLTMRVRALGVENVNGTPMFGMRMSFVRPKEARAPTPGVSEFLFPKEQILRLAGGQELKPAYVHTKARQQDRIELTGLPREVVELLYPLPKDRDGAGSIFSYNFRWTVHYGAGKSESQAPKFDRYDSAPQGGAEVHPEDPNYPFDISPMELPGWTVIRDPFWWALDPWWPWF